jgi:hypothetical protein
MTAIEPLRSRITLIEAGESIGGNGWRDPVQKFKDFLVANSGSLAYAYVNASNAPFAAKAGSSLELLPARSGFDPRRQVWWAFEGSHAPDAFGLQLLGPGYAGHVPAGKSWHATQLGDDRVLLEHLRPELWFGPGNERDRIRHTDGSLPEAPPFFVEARADFGQRLFTQELLREF